MTEQHVVFPSYFGEPLATFIHRTYECRVYEGPTGNPNGYVAVPNAIFKVYDDVNTVFWSRGFVGCNGEWTYCKKFGDVTVIGFDTSHSHDGPHTQNVNWVSEELRRGVDNLIYLSFAPLPDFDEATYHTGEQELTLGYMINAMLGPEEEENDDDL